MREINFSKSAREPIQNHTMLSSRGTPAARSIHLTSTLGIRGMQTRCRYAILYANCAPSGLGRLAVLRKREGPGAFWSIRLTPEPSRVRIRGADLPRWARPELDDRSESGMRRVALPRRLQSVLVSRAPGWSKETQDYLRGGMTLQAARRA
jgi:hypothetical protein